jgi:hypothetical protein
VGARPRLFFLLAKYRQKPKTKKNKYFKNEVFFGMVSIAKSEKLK